MSVTAVERVTIGLETECCASGRSLYEQLRRGYELCAVLSAPDSLDAYRAAHRTARKRASRSARLGYVSTEILRRSLYVDDVFAVNTSLTERQGRPMTAGYLERPSASELDPITCDRHWTRMFATLLDETLVAYSVVIRAGDLALVSQILGHGEHLKSDVMFLLFESVIDALAGTDVAIVYNRADSGDVGLQYFKEKLGFEPREVTWAR